MKVSQSIWIQLQPIKYNQAIDRYNYLKTRFLNEYATAANVEDEAAQEEFEKHLATTINTDVQKLHQLAEVKGLYQDILALMKQKMSNDKGMSKSISEIKRTYKSKERGAKAKAIKQAEALGETLISETELKDFIVKSLSRYQVGTSFAIDDILAQVKGYRTRVLTRSSSMKRAIDITKGYYQEALVYKAFEQFSSTLDAQLNVLAAGAVKVQGKDTLYDTYLRFFQKLDNTNFSQIVTDKLDTGYGLQSKSWTLPWLDERVSQFSNIKYGFSLGRRDALLSGSGLKNNTSDIYTWFQGVSFLERHAVEALGENQVGFITKNGFIWTADMISYFRAMDYFLAFGYKENKPLSPVVSWTPVEQQ